MGLTSSREASVHDWKLRDWRHRYWLDFIERHDISDGTVLTMEYVYGSYFITATGPCKIVRSNGTKSTPISVHVFEMINHFALLDDIIMLTIHYS